MTMASTASGQRSRRTLPRLAALALAASLCGCPQDGPVERGTECDAECPVGTRPSQAKNAGAACEQDAGEGGTRPSSGARICVGHGQCQLLCEPRAPCCGGERYTLDRYECDIPCGSTGNAGKSGAGGAAGRGGAPGNGGTGAVSGSGAGNASDAGTGVTNFPECEAFGGVRLLVVTGNTPSMRAKQSALSLLIRELNSGEHSDLLDIGSWQIGITTTDIGVGGVPDLPGCKGVGNDGALVQPACGAELTDSACLPGLSFDGCSTEQHLEAMLKALWPAKDIDPETGEERIPNRITFVGDGRGSGSLGHGDASPNLEFLRSDPNAGRPTLLAILILSDTEDCSSLDTRHLTPAKFLPQGDPLAEQAQALRCHLNPKNLYDLDRYAEGLTQLLPEVAPLLVFGVIAGVPQELVDDSARAGVDFANGDLRNKYYDDLLAAPAMQEVSDGERLAPSCTSTAGEVAPPARRLVGLARRIGANSMVGSICDDPKVPIRAFLATMARAIESAQGADGLCSSR